MIDTGSKDCASVEDKYVFPRNCSERERLQNQHRLFTDLLGGRLIIEETIKLKPGSRVLDSGTGAASWILDLASDAPKGVEFVGIDISATMFPDDAPHNVQLHQMSSLDLPANWTTSFDLVNQRLLIAAFTIDQWRSVLSELFRVLKPGGAVQLIEFGEYGSSCDIDALPATKAAYNFGIFLYNKRGLLGNECGRRLPSLLAEAGFYDVQVKIHQLPIGKRCGEIGVRGAQNWASVLRSFGEVCLEEGGLSGCSSQDAVDAKVDRAQKEWNDNPDVFREVYTITAKKSL
ncbi:hypothetical protein ACEPAI_1763 [Sanghuangporus weigelae]